MKKILVLVLLIVSASSYAQKLKVTGSLKPLKGQKSVFTEFVYTDMLIGKDGQTEEAYLKKRKTELNEKEPGRGDKFEKQWFDDRIERFQPQFRELFGKNTDMSTVDDKAQYTLIFKTTRTEPGWNVGIMRASAFIDAEVQVVETKNKSNVIATITITKSPGRDAMGYDYESGVRIMEAYAKAGKELGQLFAKELK